LGLLAQQTGELRGGHVIGSQHCFRGSKGVWV
jgi:hypothetical protein